jgi:hypothetical protein
VTGNERFQAIGTVSGSLKEMKTLHKQLGDLLKEYDMSDVKFSKIKGDSTYTQISKEFTSLGLKKCHEGTIRVNVMVWDTQDSRHSVKGRDDIENFKRMYYHILKVTIKQWNNQFRWEFYPDEHTAINWQEIAFYLSRTNLSKVEGGVPFLFEKFREFNFAKIHPPKESTSSKFYIIQLADLFAGIVRTSHLCGRDLIEWRQVNCPGNSLFPANQDSGISKNQNAKFKVMSHFKDIADSYRLGVNLSEDKYFQTFNHHKNIFLWKYEPQHENDKAPVKIKGYIPKMNLITNKPFGHTPNEIAIVEGGKYNV